MELWVRSQDKETLVKANALWIMDNQIWMEVPFYENHKKLGLTVTGHNHKLAQYKTKKRALEVLDEIQNILILNKKFDGNYQESDLQIKALILSNMVKVFQMPSE